MGRTPSLSSDTAADDPLGSLLAHPALWRGRSLARTDTHSTGYLTLDEALPGGGWPANGLSEILSPYPGLGELRLLMPLLVRFGQQPPARWVAWIAPPFEPYAPALAGAGVPLERQLVVRTDEPLWALEQAIESGACATVLGWLKSRPGEALQRSLRRLQLAAQRQRTPVFLFREVAAARCASPAELRLELHFRVGGARLQLLKSRGGRRGAFDIEWSFASGAVHGTP